MPNKYNHPLIVQLVDTCRDFREAKVETHGKFGARAGTSKQYVQKFELYDTEPRITRADDLLRGAGKKLIIVDIDFDEQLIQTLIQTSKN